MAAMGGNQRQTMEDAAEDKFPEGLRVLAVDDDRVCLKPNDHNTGGALCHQSPINFAWLQLLDGIPRHDHVFHLVVSYHLQRQWSYCSCAYI
uniref:Uncharacterized protein n=1 Tax=Aegilops tauschii TaxID=37682 RepID=M8CKM6_AEGTA